jgi:hypothetical protein
MAEKDVRPRSEKICSKCVFYQAPTADMEAECLMEEDMKLPDWCDMYEKTSDHPEVRR